MVIRAARLAGSQLGSSATEGLRAVDVTPVCEANNQDDETIVLNLVQNSVVTDTDSVSIGATGQLDRAWRPRVVCKRVDARRDPSLGIAW